MKFRVSQDVAKIFHFTKMEGPLWECDEAKQLQGKLGPKGRYPNDPPLLFPNLEDDPQLRGEPDPQYFMRSNYVCRVMTP